MTREELKMMFLQMDCSNIPVKKEIVVEIGKNPYWKGYGTIQIISDTKDGYSSFKTHQEFPMEYALSRKEYKSGSHKLIIKQI